MAWVWYTSCCRRLTHVIVKDILFLLKNSLTLKCDTKLKPMNFDVILNLKEARNASEVRRKLLLAIVVYDEKSGSESVLIADHAEQFFAMCLEPSSCHRPYIMPASKTPLLLSGNSLSPIFYFYFLLTMFGFKMYLMTGSSSLYETFFVVRWVWLLSQLAMPLWR